MADPSIISNANASVTGPSGYGDTPAATAAEPGVYTPTERDKQVVAEIERKYQERKREREAHEPQWFLNTAFFRGNHNVTWSNLDNSLVSTALANPARTKRQINRVFAKVRARRAMFLKNRPTWVVVAATSDIKDKLDARATGKVLEYIWRKLKLENKYRDVVLWSESCSRGYWWFYWDDQAIGRVSITDPMSGEKSIHEAVVGEVGVEVGSPFEVLIDNPGAVSLAYVDELIRAKERSLDYVKQRYPEKAAFVSGESPATDANYANQIATLNTTGGGYGSAFSASGTRRDAAGTPTTVVVKEFFKRPTPDLPKGKYCVVANNVLLKEQDELPYGFHDLENPFPCVEFCDVPTPGQYWGTTVLEQMIDLQREYNNIRSMISTQIKLMGHPKVFVAKQHQMADSAWTPDAGEIVEYTARPGIPPPTPWIPPNIVADAWRAIDLLKKEFDDITQIFPATEGGAGGAQSGFQTNLLQEGSQAVHAPDIRGHELAIEEAAFKIRRIIKQGYEVRRLVTVTSGAYEPEMFEFAQDDVDENADIIVQAGSALPMLKGARIQSALDLFEKGVLGDPADPQVRRRLLNVLDLGGMDDIYEYNRINDDMVNIENGQAEDGQPIAAPRFYEDHQAHWTGHINRLKSPAVMKWPSPARMGLLAHAILHAAYINHAAAYQMSIEAGLEGLIPPPMPVMPGPQGAAPGQMTPPGQGGPAEPPSGGGAPPPASPGGGSPPSPSAPPVPA